MCSIMMLIVSGDIISSVLIWNFGHIAPPTSWLPSTEALTPLGIMRSCSGDFMTRQDSDDSTDREVLCQRWRRAEWEHEWKKKASKFWHCTRLAKQGGACVGFAIGAGLWVGWACRMEWNYQWLVDMHDSLRSVASELVVNVFTFFQFAPGLQAWLWQEPGAK